MKKKFMTNIILIVFIIALIALLPQISIITKFNKSNQIINKIEIYRLEHKKLPTSLEDIGEKTSEEGPIYYEKRGDQYQIWFGTTLGESKIYDSKTGKWNTSR